jgi:peptidoglycan hydrolase-like protein with peptidoglycan-binding domain
MVMVFNLFSPFGGSRDDHAETETNAWGGGPFTPDRESNGVFRSPGIAGEPGRWESDVPLVGNSVGWRARNEREDVEEVERTLHETGDLDTDRTDGPTGFFGDRMDEGIKTAQKRNGLRPDGIITPDGPTDRALREEKRQRRRTDPVMPFETGEKPVSGNAPDVPLPRAKPTDIAKAFQQREREQPNRPNTPARHDDPLMPFAKRQDRESPSAAERASPKPNKAESAPVHQKREIRRPDGSKAPDLLALPAEKTKAVQHDNWRTFQRAADQDPDISRRRRNIYAKIYAWEGGSTLNQDPESTAYAGVVQGTLDGLRGQGRLPEIDPDARTHELKTKQLPRVYDAYFDDQFRGLGGSDVLDEIPDAEVAGAIGDTLFRHPYKESRRAIQRAVNQVSDKEVAVDGLFGPGTLAAVKKISKEPKRRVRFLDALAQERKKAVAPEGSDKEGLIADGDRLRFNYFRSQNDGGRL